MLTLHDILLHSIQLLIGKAFYAASLETSGKRRRLRRRTV